MSQRMYNDRNLMNVPPQQQNAEVNSVGGEVPLNAPWSNAAPVSGDYYSPQHLPSNPAESYYTPTTNGSYYCAQPREQPHNPNAWPSWSTEPNNNPPTPFETQAPTLFNPQAPIYNPQHHDPWQWSVGSNEANNAQWQPPIQQQPPGTEQITQPEQAYYNYGQDQTHWQYSTEGQPNAYETTPAVWSEPPPPPVLEKSANSWNTHNNSTPQEHNANLTFPNESFEKPPENAHSWITPDPIQSNASTQPLKIDSSPSKDSPTHAELNSKSVTDCPPLGNENQVDEPNQEVPEPFKPKIPSPVKSIESSFDTLESISGIQLQELEEPPNEQVPSASGNAAIIAGQVHSSATPSPVLNQTETVTKAVVIQPWEGGPFQPPPPRQTNNIIQQEETEHIESITSDLENLDLKREDIVANLESEPDNLERPPDSEANKINPHHLALHRQHFSEELDGTTSKTSLWENPNLPNILFMPAEPSRPSSAASVTAQITTIPSIIPLPVSEEYVAVKTIEKIPSEQLTRDIPEPLIEAPLPPVSPLKIEPKTTPEDLPRRPPPQPIPNEHNSIPREPNPIQNVNQQPLTHMMVPPEIPLRVQNNPERMAAQDELRKTNPEWDESTNALRKPQRYQEMEDLDRRDHYNSSRRYSKDKNERYYYEESRERNSRPSSRASEPIPDNYSGRYYNPPYGSERPRGDYYSQQNPPPLPPREGTPSRGLIDNEGRPQIPHEYSGDGRLRQQRPDEYGSEGGRRRPDEYGSEGGRRRPDEYGSEGGRRRPDEYGSEGGRRRPDEYGSEDKRRILDGMEVMRRRNDEYGSEGGMRRPEEYGSEGGRRRPEEYGSDGKRRIMDGIEVKSRNDEYASDGSRHRPAEYENDTRDLRDRKGYEDERQTYARGREEDYYNRNTQAYNKGYNYDYYQQRQDPYSMYYNYYNYNYGFYDELYRNNPKYREQMEQYRAYYTQMGYESDRLSVHSGRSSVNEEIRKERYPKDYDTGSEYSGYQPSLPYETSFTPAEEPDSLNDSESRLTPAARLTPAKFSCPHPVGRLYPGKLLALLPLTSINNCSLEMHDLQQSFLLDKNYQDVKAFPGPLLSGHTHKNDVIQFCQQKISSLQCNLHATDRDSQILLWELLVLMLRQNGNVSGSDIAELLLKDRQPTKLGVPSGRSVMRQASAAGSSSSPSEEASELPVLITTAADGSIVVNDTTTPSPDEGIVVSQDSRLLNSGVNLARESTMTVDQITQKFTEYLLFGHKKDALEWATKHGLWGHALFLASKMDSRSYANIMTRFANSLPLNDPLQTLYQLMSGRQPSAVTRVADEKWGDWRPHLAMILSNLSSQPEVDCRSITTLGDTLAQKGCLSAAHFCYLMAQVEFGRYDNKASKLVLLTSNHLLPFSSFITNEAIQCTEIYEYAQSLANPNFFIPHLQPYKLIYAARLVDYGLLPEALHYCEVMSTLAMKSTGAFSTSLLTGVSRLAWKLKHQDPQYTQCQGELEDIPDPEWLLVLDRLITEAPSVTPNSTFTTQETYATTDPGVATTAPYASESEGWVTNADGGYIPPTSFSAPQQPEQQVWSQNQLNQNTEPTSWAPNQTNQNIYSSNVYATAYGQPVEQTEPISEANEIQNNDPSLSGPQAYYESQPPASPTSPTIATKASFDYYGATTQHQVPALNRERQDSIGSYGGRRDSSFSSSSLTTQMVSSNRQDKDKPGSPLATSQQPKKEAKNKPQAGRSWLGGIFSKLLPKGPNQMILPDDKNPAIVWDPKTNKWMNQIDDDSSSAEAAPLAPPTDMELNPQLGNSMMPPMNASPMGSLPNSLNSSMSSPGPPTGINRFQRQKHKGMRQNYVDVLNVNNSSGGGNSTNFQPAANPLGSSDSNLFPKIENSAPPSYFVPSPSTNLDGPGDFVSPAHSVEHPLSSADNSEIGSDNSLRMFDPAEFSTAPKITGDVNPKRTLGGYLTSRRAYPSS